MTVSGTTTYVYDNANRLTSAGGVTHTWDNNGNLLSDGTSTYTYDKANRLKTVVQGGTTYGYVYNGLGDRLRQTVNGTPTTYAVDMAGGLTQVLGDGTNFYLYGTSRIGEKQTGGWRYHVPDALGSVRQLIDSSGAVTLAKAYAPFGNSYYSYGTGSTAFQFVGEQRDASSLVFLRARYYSSYLNQWIQPDPIVADPYAPADWNLYAYVRNNPANHTDPSGLNPNCREGPHRCALKRAAIEILGNEHGLKGLLELFNDQELYTVWGAAAGRTVSQRLDWVLGIARSHYVIPISFLDEGESCGLLPLEWSRLAAQGPHEYYGGGYGFRGIEDYAVEFTEQDKSDQSSHFLTAVGLTRTYGETAAIIAMVTHEKAATNLEDQLRRVRWDVDLDHFRQAIRFDERGERGNRDDELWAILEFPAKTPFGEEVSSRRGNTLADLRLSVKGLRFSQWASSHAGLPPWSAAYWLHGQLAAPGVPRPSRWWHD